MRRLSLLFATLMLLSVSCTENISEPTNTGGISGFVVDKTTGDPVQTVNVKLKETGASTVTGSDGSFTFKNLENGEYTVLLSKEGYNDNSNTIQVTNGRTAESHFTIERIPAVLTIDREVLDFGDNYSNTTLSFSMVNKNYVDLDWEIVYSCRWIKEVDPMKSIVKLGFGKTQTVVVIIDRDALLPGNNETIIVVRTSDGASELPVKAVGQEKRLATLNISETSDIKATSAVLHAEITDKGIPAYTERGFVLGESAMPTEETALKKLPAAVTEQNDFSVKVDELSIGKTYYVRAYAINQQGIAYSTNQDKFTTIAVLPSVSILSTTEIQSSSAILNATITNIGTPEYSERGFVLGDSEMPTIETALKVYTVEKDAQSNYSVRAGDLSLGKTYYVRAFAKNAVGVAYSSSMNQFTTVAILPVVSTLAATDEDRDTKTVVLRGTISFEGDPGYTEKGFVWSTVYEKPTIEETKIQIAGNGVGDFEKRVTFTSIQKSIYVRAYAINQRGVAYGESIIVFMVPYIELNNNHLAVQRTDINNGVPLTWSNAINMCKNSSIGGFHDWRVPNEDEIYILYNLKDSIGGFTTGHYWTSKQTPGWSIYYNALDFSSGQMGGIHYNHDCYARCVRSL